MCNEMNREMAADVLREQFEAEERDGFGRLSVIPDTQVWRFLHYYRTLDAAEAVRLKVALALRGAARFVPSDAQVYRSQPPDPALGRCNDATQRLGTEWKFNSLKLLKMTAGWVRSKHPRAKAEMRHVHVPDEIIQWIEGMDTCKAPELRKLVKLALHSRFGLKAENNGGGVWIYKHPANSQPFSVEIDYGGTWGQQLRYEIHIESPLVSRSVRGVRYESLMGIGGGDWDFITTGNADQSIAALCDLIDHTVRLVDRVFAKG